MRPKRSIAKEGAVASSPVAKSNPAAKLAGASFMQNLIFQVGWRAAITPNINYSAACSSTIYNA
jgi:hypothetical protein